ncbi:hypothetical protein HY605_03490 [Candidatus Peregrinibacteria bacterium]|nr:hypothetical protein [Candidatus Peregrinibacteria bacterium]
MKEILSKLFREIEHDIGTRELNTLVFESLIGAIKNFEFKDVESFKIAFEKIIEDISSTEPKISIVIDHCCELYHHFLKILNTHQTSNFTAEHIIEELIKRAEQVKHKDAKARIKLLQNAGDFLDIENKKILIYDHSHTVQDVLIYLKNEGKHFNVIIAEQDLEKTEENIASLHSAKIPFKVVPAYMLSYYDDEVDMLFFGALTFKNTYDFVLDTGSLALISEFHLSNKATYLFMTTSKFALWKSEKKTEIFTHPHFRKHSKKEIEYQRMKFSHDRVPSDLFSKIITDEGVFSPDELKKLYDQKFEKCQGKVLGN